MEFLTRGFSKKPERVPSRDELLESGGDFTVEELRNFGLGPEEVCGGNIARPLLYINDRIPLRLIPNRLVSTLTVASQMEFDPKFILETLHSAFVIYRECVNRDFEAPVVLEENAWQWPDPVLCGWDDLDGINYLGLAMGSMADVNTTTISVVEADKRISKDILTGKITEERLSNLRLNPDKILKFKVRKLSDLRMVNSQSWQQLTLRSYALGVMRAIDSVKQNGVDKDIENFARYLLREALGFVTNVPAVRYAKDGEKKGYR